MFSAATLCGILWACAMGLAVGNYACSVIHRLPRGRLLLDKKPYCGNCGELLQVRDLFPVVSALMLRHRCRYCGVAYPVTHTIVEICVALLFVLSFLLYGFGEQAILIMALGTFLVILAAIEVNENIIMGRVLLCVLITGALLRVLVDGQLFNLIGGGVYGVALGAWLFRKAIRREGHIYMLPKKAQLLAAGGLCAGMAGFGWFVAIFAALYMLLWKAKARATIAFGIAVWMSIILVSNHLS